MPLNKGEKLELEVYLTLQKLMNSEELGLLASNCKIFHHKKYFSKDRNADIITDVSIEVYYKGSNEPYLIWIWECKNYNNSIPIDDIEEFHAKLEQIGADKTKGTFITSNGCFQSSCFAYAQSKGIGLARLMPENQIEHLLYMLTSEKMPPRSNPLTALTNLKYVSSDDDFFVSFDKIFSNSFKSYLMKELSKIHLDIDKNAHLK